MSAKLTSGMKTLIDLPGVITTVYKIIWCCGRTVNIGCQTMAYFHRYSNSSRSIISNSPSHFDFISLHGSLSAKENKITEKRRKKGKNTFTKNVERNEFPHCRAMHNF